MNLRDLIDHLAALAERHGDRTVITYGPRNELSEVGRVELIGDPDKPARDDTTWLC